METRPQALVIADFTGSSGSLWGRFPYQRHICRKHKSVQKGWLRSADAFLVSQLTPSPAGILRSNDNILSNDPVGKAYLTFHHHPGLPAI